MKKIILGIIIALVAVKFGGIIIQKIKDQDVVKKDTICKQATEPLKAITKGFETELNKRGEPWGIQNTTELLEVFHSPKQGMCLGSFHIHLELAKTAKAEFIAKLLNYPTDKKDIYLIKSSSQESPLFTTDDKTKLDAWVKDNK
jgi:hypothetical protein